MEPDSGISDLADLLGSEALLESIVGRQVTPREPLLTRISQTSLDLIGGRKGSRRQFAKQLFRRLVGKKKTVKQELSALLPTDEISSANKVESLLPGIAHYGLFHAEIGIGQGARRVATAMKTAGIPASRHNISLAQFQSKVEFDASDELVSSHDTVLLQFNADTFLDLFRLFPLAALFRRRRIGHWVWELPVLPAQWVPALDKLHEVWAPSRFVAEAVANATNKPVRIVPYPVPVEDYPRAEARERLNLPRDDFIFLTIFDSNSFPIRKNAIGALRAFMDAFPKDGPSSPVLVIKCHGRGNRGADFASLVQTASTDHRVILIDRVFSENEMMLIQSACDCLVSLHRAEGFGLNIAECMGKGKLVVATDYSGSTDFARPENSLLVPYKMAEVGKSQYTYGGGQWWAEPDHDAAVEAIRRAASNASDVQRLAAAARADIMREYSFEAIGKIAKAAWRCELEPFKS